MDPPAVPEGFRAVAVDVIDSTMAEARRRAAAGESGPLWILARRQTSGRGRRGRPWISEAGNLYATLFLRDPAPASRLGDLCFVAGVALHQAVSTCVPPESSLRLKWPNDLLLDDAKLAGVLVEGEGWGGRTEIAVGFGVNCSHHPDVPHYPATALAKAGVTVTPDRLFGNLAESMAHWLAVWRQGRGFQEVRAAWLMRAKGVGEPIVVRLADRNLEGVFDSLDERGQLMLRLASGVIRPVAAGEVFFGGGR